MSAWMLGVMLGLGLGLCFQRMGWDEPRRVRAALAGRDRMLLRVLGTALFGGMMLVAGLGWLAVLDVDHLEVPPLDGGVVLGALMMGAAMGAVGYTPGSLLAALGGGRILPALSALGGAVAGAWCVQAIPGLIPALKGLFPPLEGTVFRTTLTAPILPALSALGGAVAGAWCVQAIPGLIPALKGLFPPLEGTVFRTTLTAPWLLPGGFWMHGAVGLALLLVLLCAVRSRPSVQEEMLPAAARTAEENAQQPPTPEDTAAETLVAALPQEEPLTLDTVPAELPEKVREALTEEAPDAEEASSEEENEEKSKD